MAIVSPIWRIFPATAALALAACTATPEKPAENPAQASERIQYFSDSTVSSRGPLVDGKIDGVMIDYYPDGKVRAERMFRNDLQHGRSVWYYPEGQIKEVQNFADGRKEGGDTVWYADGRLQFVMSFQQGKKHGLLQKWDSSGQLIFHARYRGDTLVEVKGKPIRPEHREPGIN
jgi:antitoxin component YwqK of YwqJK toxin-antitoxin module